MSQDRDLTRGVLAGLADGIKSVLAKVDTRRWGFVLIVFPLDDPDPHANYISNCSRADTIPAIKEWLARQEGRMSEGTDTAQ